MPHPVHRRWVAAPGAAAVSPPATVLLSDRAPLWSGIGCGCCLLGPPAAGVAFARAPRRRCLLPGCTDEIMTAVLGLRTRESYWGLTGGNKSIKAVLGVPRNAPPKAYQKKRRRAGTDISDCACRHRGRRRPIKTRFVSRPGKRLQRFIVYPIVLPEVRAIEREWCLKASPRQAVNNLSKPLLPRAYAAEPLAHRSMHPAITELPCRLHRLRCAQGWR